MTARSGSPLIVTLFSGQPEGGVSAFAREQHERWGVTDASVAAHRRAEDECALRALGDTVRAEWVDALDAIYRNPAYDSDENLFGTLLPEDLELVDRLVAVLEREDASEFVVPLGVGNHVDHQLAFRTGRRLAARGADVWAYADIPYALDERGLTPRLGRGTVREVRLTRLDADAFHRKLAAIECYSSQLPVIFRSYGDHRAALDRYHRMVGGGEWAEICWRVLPSRR